MHIDIFVDYGTNVPLIVSILTDKEFQSQSKANKNNPIVECDNSTEEKCYNRENKSIPCANIADGGCPCPGGKIKCNFEGFPGVCTDVCCDWDKEEMCYNGDNKSISCANISDGGCTCPEGQEKCGAFEGFPGFCTSVCCGWDKEVTCYNENNHPKSSCENVADGGCNCPEDQENCGTFGFWQLSRIFHFAVHFVVLSFRNGRNLL